MSEIVYYTEEGLEKLRKELEHLKTTERRNVARQISEARDKGDLSENAEYDAAKEAQGLLEAKIAKMESEFSKARILDESQIDVSKVLNRIFPLDFIAKYYRNFDRFIFRTPFFQLSPPKLNQSGRNYNQCSIYQSLNF